MSKAFTRESDDLPEPPRVTRPLIAPGVKNYLTPDGAEKLRKELAALNETMSFIPPIKNEPVQLEQQQARQRIFEIELALSEATVVPPPPPPWDQVLFGATVTVRDLSGQESHYRIVGAAETDLDKNWIGWNSPLAKALLKARLGQQIKFHAPDGEQQWEVVAINYATIGIQQ